ncbi:MAG: type II toxin-antitoxin system RelE/ParE family toxin [Desulfobacteraceae bacterium]|nr:type II toxin-antitoxin system RelE/ParE family toxin [Desulfobacteraceae bacterium]
MFKITFKKSVTKDLKKISRDQVNNILDKIESNLSKTPEQYPELKGKFAGLRKFRVANYRIIFAILEEKTVLITRIRHRKESYK